MQRLMLAIHGGAGNFGIQDAGEERIADCREVLRQAMHAGKAKLEEGASSLDIIEAAIVIMEDSPLFNAGRGSVFSHDETHELDACIMRGTDRGAGAVANVTGIRNPIRAARAVLEHSEHVLLAGPGAEAFARERGIRFEDAGYFATEERRGQLEKARAEEHVVLDHEGGHTDDKFGTVGAVALDRSGTLAAGTSTGGMTNKRFGRIGDSPVPGAGTYADGNVAVSCTGHGEFFLRYVVAHDVAARVRIAKESLERAASNVVYELDGRGGSGGLIAVDRHGNVALPMNTTGMFRGWLDSQGEIHVAVFR